jgi:acyl-CoA synthetase (AMP-forming)/AMP-acid ligase II
MVALNQGGKYNLKSLVTHRGSEGWNAMVTLGTTRWHRQFAGYGQSETMGLVSIGGFTTPGVGTHGRPSPLAVIKIFDDEGKEVPVGETGEIVVRGYTVMNGYHQKDGEPLERTINGWHRTNDLGRREKDGSISFIGPKQRMIKSGVENIYPSELEGCIRKLEGVADVAVIGIPDERWIQTVKAIVVLKAAGAQNEKSVIEHCKQYLASYKKPSSVVFVDSIPKKDIYFNDYDKLDAKFGGGNYPGGNTRSR